MTAETDASRAEDCPPPVAGDGIPHGTVVPTGTGELLAAVDADGVLTVVLNRPQRRNAMTADLESAYLALLRAGEADPRVRAVVVTGAGNAFCAGADLSALHDLSAGAADDSRHTARDTDGPPPEDSTVGATRDPGYPLTFAKPLIAAIDGPCIGLGFAQALFCDIRFASERATLATAYARRGLIAEYGTAWLLPRLVGRGHALDLLLSGRTVDAAEARGMGLVQRVLPAAELLPAALEYARELARLSAPTSMAVIKAQVDADARRGADAALASSFALMLESFARPDLVEGLAALGERRAPRFAPWPPADPARGPARP
ncbi:enoyl-CoA hydratase-related protein (plasmid) [Embleya sp. NBC_00888]|uniref:enoyl-CoA hydratase-related protein n=1 Tax=Embleya sp. NBC_00888 TaxID=2975960 RepID=UPI002F914B0E|nr:enoyl-CoA hydratase-related protein [Embleya sp. NBC_00888]